MSEQKSALIADPRHTWHDAIAARLDIAKAIAAPAAKALLGYRGKLRHIAFKGAVDLVTEADRSVEAILVEALGAALPEDQLIGEEGGERNDAHADFVWFIDPLDGTTNFVHGLPHFAVSLGFALRQEGKLWAAGGVIAAPALVAPGSDEIGMMWSGAHGLGAFRSGLHGQGSHAIHVSDAHQFDQVLAASGFPYDHAERAAELAACVERALERVRCLRRLGSAALDLAHVADGSFGAYWELGLKPWDLAAGAAIVEAAGGIVTDYQGGDDFLGSGTIVACNAHLHSRCLRDIVHGVHW